MSTRSTMSSFTPVSNCEHAVYWESSLLQLRDTGIASDVSIVCGSQTFRAHKIILVASSGYFYNIFTNKLKKDVKHIAMTDITPEILKIILDYIYTGLLNVNRFMKVNQEALIRALHHLDMADVYRHRLRLMMKSLAPNHYTELWSLADVYQMKDMSLEIAKYISQNLELCMNNSQFVNLTLQQLIAVLSCAQWRGQSESMILEAIQKWILHDIRTRERYALSLLSVAKVTVAAKTKAIAFYDNELQTFLLAPNRKKPFNCGTKKGGAKKVSIKDTTTHTSQMLISSTIRTEKNEKVIRTWKKKQIKIEDATNVDTTETLNNFEFNLQQRDYQIEVNTREENEEDLNLHTNVESFTTASVRAEIEIHKLEREVQVLSPVNENDEDQDMSEKIKSTFSDERSILFSSSDQQKKSYLCSDYLQTKLLPPSAIPCEIRNKLKNPIRVHSIDVYSDPPKVSSEKIEVELHQFPEEKVQIVELKTKLNSIINRFRSTLQKNNITTKPSNFPTSDDESSVYSKHSDSSFGDFEPSKRDATSNYEDYLNSPRTSYENYFSDSMKDKLVSNLLNTFEDHTDEVKIALKVENKSPDNNMSSNTFRVLEKQSNNKNTHETTENGIYDGKNLNRESNSWEEEIVLKRPIAPTNESLISPEEVRSRLEKFKRLMHTKSSSPVDLEKINLKGSRSFIISSNNVDVLDVIDDPCDFLSDISEADIIIDRSIETDECLVSQPEWFRALSTIPEEASIGDYTGSPHTDIELQSVNSDSPLKFAEKCKSLWSVRDTKDNSNYLCKQELNDLDRSLLNDNNFGSDMSSETSSRFNAIDDNLPNNIQQLQLTSDVNENNYLKKESLRYAMSPKKNLNSFHSKLNKQENDESEYTDPLDSHQMTNRMADKLRTIDENIQLLNIGSKNEGLPFCKLNTFNQNKNKESENNNNASNSYDDMVEEMQFSYQISKVSSKFMLAKDGETRFNDYKNREEFEKQRDNNVFEFGGYQCFAERSAACEEVESITARSNDTLNITLENLVTASHNKIKSMPIANDTWKMWKSKLEASCKPSPRPSTKSSPHKTEMSKTAASSVPRSTNQQTSANDLVTTLNTSIPESEELKTCLKKRLFSPVKREIIKPNISKYTNSDPIPEISFYNSLLSSTVSPNTPLSSPKLINQSRANDGGMSEPSGSTATSSPMLELSELTNKDDDPYNMTSRTQVISSCSHRSRNFIPLTENTPNKYESDKKKFSSVSNENKSQTTSPSPVRAFDRLIYKSPKYKLAVESEFEDNPEEGPLLILLATNKNNKASQQVYCLRKRCWLAERRLLMPPIENSYSVGYYEGNVYFIGGLVNGSFRKTNSVLVYRGKENTLVSASDLLVARVGGGVANLNKMIYVAGGIGRYHKPIAQVERYDIKADRWHLVAALRIARTNVCLVSSGKLLYAIGGTVTADSVDEVVSKACESYDSEMDQWSLLVELPSHFLMTNPLVTSVDNKLHAVRISKPDVVFRFHTRKNKWLPIQNTKLNASKVCSLLPGERKLYAVELAGKAIYVFDMHAFQWEVETYFPADLHWQATAFVIGLDENNS